MTLSFKGAFHDIFSCLTCRIGSGKQVASVIVDDGKDQDDEDDTFVVEDAHAIQNDVDLVSSNAMKKHLPINPPLRGCSLFCFLSTETKWCHFCSHLGYLICNCVLFLLNAWLEAILREKKLTWEQSSRLPPNCVHTETWCPLWCPSTNSGASTKLELWVGT